MPLWEALAFSSEPLYNGEPINKKLIFPRRGDMKENNLTVKRTARYFTLGDASGELEEVWIVCHGMGQLGAYFIKNFIPIDNGRRLIVAPEALSRFYLDA